MAVQKVDTDTRYQALVVALRAESGRLVWLATGDGLAKDFWAWCEYTGQQPEEMEGTTTWLEAVHEADRQRLWASFQNDGKYIKEGTYRVRNAVGSYCPFVMRLAPVCKEGEDGVYEWVGVCIEQLAERQDAPSSPEDEAVADNTAANRERVRQADQFMEVFEAIADSVYVYDREGRIIYFNAAAQKFLGRMPWPDHTTQSLAERAAGLVLLDEAGEPLPLEKVPSYRILHGEVLAEGQAAELQIVLSDAEVIWLNVAGAPTRDADGRLTGGVVIFRDVTEQRRLTGLLWDSERDAATRASALGAIFESMTDGVVVYDIQGKILRMNRAYRDYMAINEHPEHETMLLEQRGAELNVRGETGTPLPREQWPAQRMLRGEILTGVNAMDIRLRALDGHDVQFNVSGAPMRDKEGQIVGGVLILRDVTERRGLERRTLETLNALLAMAEALVTQLPAENEALLVAELEEARVSLATRAIAKHLAELMRSVLGCERIGITAVEPETKLMYPLAVVGLGEEAEQRWWAEQQQQHVRISEVPQQHLVERLLAHEALVLDMRQPPFRDAPNPYGIRTMLAVPMCIGDQLVGLLTLDYGGLEHSYTQEEKTLAGTVANLAGLVIERERLLHERAEARAGELALREANRRMDEFLGIASHELKTPLTTIKGNVQLAARRVKTSIEAAMPDARGETLRHALKMAQELLARTNTQIDRLARLVNDLLDVSRIQAQRLELQVGSYNLTKLMSEVVAEQQLLVSPERAITLETDVTDVAVLVDADRIRQVMTNYLTNALKYSEASSPVWITLEIIEGGHMARVSVRDQGPGLSAEEQERVWERFYRVPGIEVRSGSGVGLGVGLHICRSIIERHEGMLGVESVPGAGATFWFTLPLARP